MLASLRAEQPHALQPALDAASARGEVVEGVLEACLQALQTARREGSPQEVAQLEALARLVGVTIARASLPAPALLLSALLSSGASDDALWEQVRAAVAAQTIPSAASLAAAARALVSAYDAEERRVMGGVAKLVEAGGEGAEQVLLAAERRRATRERLAHIALLADSCH